MRRCARQNHRHHLDLKFFSQECVGATGTDQIRATTSGSIASAQAVIRLHDATTLAGRSRPSMRFVHSLDILDSEVTGNVALGLNKRRSSMAEPGWSSAQQKGLQARARRCVRVVGFEPTSPGGDGGFLDRCVCRFRHTRTRRGRGHWPPPTPDCYRMRRCTRTRTCRTTNLRTVTFRHAAKRVLSTFGHVTTPWSLIGHLQ